jgi:outer membrane protein
MVRQFTGRGTSTRVNENGEQVTIPGDRWTYSNGFSLSAELFNANRIPNLRAAQANVAAAQENIIAEGYSVRLDVETQFYNALAAQESEAAARTQLDQAQQQLDAARKRVNAGAATASDSLTALTQVANAQLALLTAQNNLRNANATLTRLVGSDVPLSAMTSDSTITQLDTLPLDSAAIVAQTTTTPAITAAKASLTAAHARRDAAKAAYFPSINAGYSRGGSGADSRFGLGDDPFSYSGSLNFSLRFPIFSQFTRQQQSEVAAVNETNAAAQLRDTQLQTKQLVIQYLGARQLGQEQVRVQTASIAAAEENLRVQQRRYDLGLATIVDVLTAQTVLNQARANLITARNTVRLATANLEALLGKPLTALPTESTR